MATFQDGGRRRATTNTVKAMERSAAARQCPKCGRKSALSRVSDEWQFGHYCRWCGYENITQRIDVDDPQPTDQEA